MATFVKKMHHLCQSNNNRHNSIRLKRNLFKVNDGGSICQNNYHHGRLTFTLQVISSSFTKLQFCPYLWLIFFRSQASLVDDPMTNC